MTSTTSTPVLDTAEMPAVHTFFRRELRLAAAAVRRVPVGDVRRARTDGEARHPGGRRAVARGPGGARRDLSGRRAARCGGPC